MTLTHEFKESGVLGIFKLKPDALLPRRGMEQSVGLDLHAYLISESGRPNTLLLPPHTTRKIPTGLAMRPPPGHAILVCSRSGLAGSGVFVTNGPGVVDPDYRGEIQVLLHNGGHQAYYVKHEERVAQILVVPVPIVPFEEITELDVTERGDKGFGSTGR